MPTAAHGLSFSLTERDKPSDYEECLVWNPCEGFQIATWKNLGDRSGFYLFASYEPLIPQQAVLWTGIPSHQSMAKELCVIREGS